MSEDEKVSAELDIVEYVARLIERIGPRENPINRTYDFRVYKNELEYWEARMQIANEFHRQMQNKYPRKNVDLRRNSDGPGAYYIGVHITNRLN